jgi:hypothetical protein
VPEVAAVVVVGLFFVMTFIADVESNLFTIPLRFFLSDDLRLSYKKKMTQAFQSLIVIFSFHY